MKTTYLYKVWTENRPLFGCILVLVSLQLFFTIKGVETFPFVHWGMYSGKIKSDEKLLPFELYIDNRAVKISALNDCQRAVVEGTLNKYASLGKSGFLEKEEAVIDKRFGQKVSADELQKIKSTLLNDSISMTKYPAWLMGYIADLRLVKNPTLVVIQGRDTLINFNYDAI